MFKKAIITSGPTREWIDPVRYISNASSGKMGFHLAESVSQWIENTIYIHGSVLEKYTSPKSCKEIEIETTSDLLNAILSEIEEDCLLIMAAAPADFKPRDYSDLKIKKKESDDFTLHLIQNPDILRTVSEERDSRNYRNLKMVGFSAETNDLDANAMKKLRKKGLDLIIGNYVGKGVGFGEVDSTVAIYNEKGIAESWKDLPKEQIANNIVSFIKFNFS